MPFTVGGRMFILAVDEFKVKGVAFHMQVEIDPAFIQLFADAVFDAILYKGQQE
jgi:hypothetical protein